MVAAYEKLLGRGARATRARRVASFGPQRRRPRDPTTASNEMAEQLFPPSLELVAWFSPRGKREIKRHTVLSVIFIWSTWLGLIACSLSCS